MAIAGCASACLDHPGFGNWLPENRLGIYAALPYIPLMQAVLVTPTFERQAAKAGLTDDEVADIVAALAADPLSGDLIPGTGGARKVRFARRGSGKSGGYRTIHYFGGDDVPIFLLALIDKRDTANLTKVERNELAIVLPKIADAYRKGVEK